MYRSSATTTSMGDTNIMGILSDMTNSNSNNVNLCNKNHLLAYLQDAHECLDSKKNELTKHVLKAKQELKQTHGAGMLKLSKAVKKMTIRDFNAQYDCNLLDIFATTNTNKKRIRTELETPAAKKTSNCVPNTVTRTVQRGEAMYSKNGTPIDTVDVGDLVATVTKKRRGRENVVFDIAIGDGKYIHLSDLNSASDLTGEMKTTAMTQLKVLQDQMASLMAQLER